MKRPLIFLLALMLVAAQAQAETLYARVVAVLDGDTVLLAAQGRPKKLRLASIDAPEKDQAFGAESRDSLVELVLEQRVRVDVVAVDKYGRLVGRLWRNDLDVCREQVQRGLAWEYSYRHADEELHHVEAVARLSRRGLWAQRDPEPPWQWRKEHADASRTYSRHDGDYRCGSKHRCSQMSSCDEAFYFLNHCRERSLDSDGDGTPCPELCLPQH